MYSYSNHNDTACKQVQAWPPEELTCSTAKTQCTDIYLEAKPTSKNWGSEK